MKDIYEMLNDIDIPDINDNEFEAASVTEIERGRIKKNLHRVVAYKKRRVNRRIAVAAVLIFVCLSMVVAVNPAFARSIPVINHLFEMNLSGINKEYVDYLSVIGKTKSHEGIDVTFESAVADDNELFLSFIVKNNNEEIINNSSDALLIPTSMQVNGKSVNTGAGADWSFIDNHTIRVLKKIDWSDGRLPDKMNIKINISELYDKKGDWGVKFFLDKSNIANKTIVKKVNTEINLDRIKGKITSVTISPLTVKIEYQGKFNDDNVFFDFVVLDDKGNGLLWNGSYSGSDGKGESIFISNEDMKSIKIIPAYRISHEISQKLPPVKLNFNNVKQLELPIDNDRSIAITNYFKDGEYLIVEYNQKYFGKESFRGIVDAPIYIMADGNEIKEDGPEAETLYNKYQNTKERIKICKIGTASDIEIGTYDGTNIRLLKDQSFTVDVKK